VYLKSVVQSFISRGTLGGIKGAIAAATIVGTEDIQINEFFDDNEFSVDISLEGGVEFENAITGSVIEEVADLSAPSGVRLRLVKFSPQEAEEDISLNDATTVRDAIDTSDDMSAADIAAFDRRGLFDAIASADAFAIDPNQTTTADTQLSADAFAIDPNQTTTSDTQVDADETFVDQNLTETQDDTTVLETFVVDVLSIYRQRWEENDDADDLVWDFFTWTELEDLFPALEEIIASDDAVQVDPNQTTTSDTQLDSDAVVVDPEKPSTQDAFASDDASAVDAIDIYDQAWEPNDRITTDLRWNFFSWTELEDLDEQLPINTMFVDDGVIINPNRTTTSDGLLSADAVSFPPKTTTSDTQVDADAVSISPNVATTADVFAADDDTVIETQETGGANKTIVPEVSASDDAVIPGGINRPETDDITASDDAATVDAIDVHDQIWEPNDTTATDLRWGFFSWTELEDIDDAQINTMVVDDTASVDTNTTPTTDTTDVSGSIDRALVRDKDDYRWDTAVDTEDVDWDFFSWVARGVTGVDDEFVTPTETVGVDDAVSFPTQTTAENISATDSEDATSQNINDYQWNETDTNETVTWDFFVWSE
jgi:hypothetical protein